MRKLSSLGGLVVAALLMLCPSCGTEADGKFCDIFAQYGDEGIELATEQYRASMDLNVRFTFNGNNGMTCLHMISQNDMPLAAAFLIERGAVPTKIDFSGNTPLLHSVRRGDLEMSRLFLEHGADPLRKNRDGESPLSLAEASQNRSMLLLLRKGP